MNENDRTRLRLEASVDQQLTQLRDFTKRLREECSSDRECEWRLRRCVDNGELPEEIVDVIIELCMEVVR